MTQTMNKSNMNIIYKYVQLYRILLNVFTSWPILIVPIIIYMERFSVHGLSFPYKYDNGTTPDTSLSQLFHRW